MAVALSLISLGMICISFSANAQSGLQTGLYSSSCSNTEAIVRSTVTNHFNKDLTVAPGLLRVHFHDCFVQELLLSGVHYKILGFEVVDDAKWKLGAACPGVVSCANILALAARDSVVLTPHQWA